MSLETNVRNALTRVATEFKTINLKVTGNSTGALTALTTTDKTSLVAAVNEIKAAVGASGDGLTMQQVEDKIALVIGAAPVALDTLAELAAALNSDANFAATMNTALGFRVRFDVAQTLTAGQKTQVLANIGAVAVGHDHFADHYTKAEIGDVTSNLVTHFESGLV